MPALTYIARKRKSIDLVFIGAPFLIMFILCFLDEGYYDFRWMKDPGNWVVFAMYWMAMVLGEFLVSLLVPRGWPTSRKVWAIIGIGAPLGGFLFAGFLSQVSNYS